MPLESTPGKRPKHTRPSYKDDGQTWPSVTTILNVLDKPALTAWKVRQALKGIKDDYTAADIGTLTHAAIAYSLDREHQPLPDFEAYSDEVRAAAKVAFGSWKQWRDTHEVVPILLEYQMASARLGYAGTVDFFGLIDGRPEVVDWKTSASVYSEYFIQTAAYAHLIADKTEHRAQALRIVRIDKGGPVDDTQPWIARRRAEAGVFGEPVILPPEGVEVPTYVSPDHFDVFTHALAAFNARKKLGGVLT